MINKLLAVIRRNPGSTRVFSQSVMLASALGVVVTFIDGQLNGWPVVTWLLGYATATTALELVLRTGRGVAISGGDYQEVADQLDSAAMLIEAANEIDILSGTLRTFTERRAISGLFMFGPLKATRCGS